jgi:hypothetical protein
MKKMTYIMFDERTGHYKIGVSSNIFFRERTLSKNFPLIKIILYSDSDIEKKLHSIFNSKRIWDEWFSLSENDINKLIQSYGFKGIDTLPRKKYNKPVPRQSIPINHIKLQKAYFTKLQQIYYKTEKILSIHAFAEEFGLERQMLRDTLNGKRKPSQDNLERICKAIGIDKKEIL